VLRFEPHTMSRHAVVVRRRPLPSQARVPSWGGFEFEHVHAEEGLSAEELKDHLDMVRQLVIVDDGGNVPRERPIDHPHLLPFPREWRCLSMLVHVVTL
jgi:hypothetical protein